MTPKSTAPPLWPLGVLGGVIFLAALGIWGLGSANYAEAKKARPTPAPPPNTKIIAYRATLAAESTDRAMWAQVYWLKRSALAAEEQARLMKVPCCMCE